MKGKVLTKLGAVNRFYFTCALRLVVAELSSRLRIIWRPHLGFAMKRNVID